MSRVSIRLPVNREQQPFQQIATKWGERSVVLESTTSPPSPLHARVTDAERPLTVSHSETPSCARPRPNHRLFPPSQIPDVPLLFPLAQGHRGRLSVPLCAHHHPCPPSAPQCSFNFPKTKLGPRPSKPATPLMGECACMRGM